MHRDLSKEVVEGVLSGVGWGEKEKSWWVLMTEVVTYFFAMYECTVWVFLCFVRTECRNNVLLCLSDEIWLGLMMLRRINEAEICVINTLFCMYKVWAWFRLQPMLFFSHFFNTSYHRMLKVGRDSSGSSSPPSCSLQDDWKLNHMTKSIIQLLLEL